MTNWNTKKTGYYGSEKEIQTTCSNLLKMYGWYVLRLNSGRIPMQGPNGRRLIMLADPGTPDTLCFKQRPSGMILLFIEYKVPGKKPTDLQKAKMAELTQYGARCLVIHSLEELLAQLKDLDNDIRQNV